MDGHLAHECLWCGVALRLRRPSGFLHIIPIHIHMHIPMPIHMHMHISMPIHIPIPIRIPTHTPRWSGRR